MEDVKRELIEMIGEKETNRFLQILKDRYYLEFDQGGYLVQNYYVDYREEEDIENYVKENFLSCENMEQLEEKMMDWYFSSDADIEYYRNIRDAIYSLDIDTDKIEELDNYIWENHYYLNYEDVYRTLYNTIIKVDISLYNGEGKNKYEGFQLIKKYIPKSLWNEFLKDKWFLYYNYMLASQLEINIKDFYELKNKKRINLKGEFVLKDACNGSYYDFDADGYEIKLDIIVSTKNIDFEYGYSIKEISGSDYYTCEIID